MKEIIKQRLKDGVLVIAYMIFYMAFFYYVENRTGVKIHILQVKADNSIPFCEYFIVPYLLWFLYVAVTAVYFTLFNKNRTEFYQFAVSMGIGMTLFLIISYVFPNGHNLRPNTFPRDNVFTEMVKSLYRTDTSTNIMPSIHVFNSVMCCVAIFECQVLKKRHILRFCTLILTISIVLATVFLKQHTILDLAAGLALGGVCWFFMYRFPLMKRQTVVGYYEER